MRAKIHRGADEVGGSCIELESNNERIVLDLGRPLWAKAGEVVPLPPVCGLEAEAPSLHGIVISHPHLDHYGLLAGVNAAVPILIGERAYRLLAEASFFTGAPAPVPPAGFLRHRETRRLGPFTITPFLNDHSAFDAYSLLIEADGQRLFYTGDIRGHGRKRGAFEELLRHPPADVDVLLMEGTNIRPNQSPDYRGPSEKDVEHDIVGLALATPGMVLAAYSPQNIDRLVTIFRAAIKSGRDLVLDLYAATMTAATGLSSVPQADWDRVRVYLPVAQRRRVVAANAFQRTAAVRASRIYPEELRARRNELIMTFRSSMVREIDEAGCLEGAHVVWSMWPGYLDEESGTRLRNVLDARNVPLSIHHSSGHAFVRDLQRLNDALRPKRLVPIHSFAGARFHELFPRVDRQADGAWWDVG